MTPTSILERALSRDTFSDLHIVDAHCHLGTGHEFYHAQAAIEQMIREADTMGVEKLCIAPEAGIECDYKYGNELMLDSIRRYPGRVYGYLCLNPFYEDEFERMFDTYYPIEQVIGVKIHPGGHRARIDCEGYQKIFHEVEKRGGFVLSHTWGDADAYCNLTLCEEAMRRFPNVRFILAHSGGTVESVKRAVQMVNRYPHIFLDTCGFDVTEHWINELTEQCPFEKILFGSDFPYHDLRYGVTRILFSNLTDSQKAGLLHENFEKLLKGCPKTNA